MGFRVVELGEEAASFGGELADRHTPLCPFLVLHVHRPGVLLERHQEICRRHVHMIDDRLDGRCDGLRVLVGEEAAKQAANSRLGHLAQEERKLGQRSVAEGEPLERALDGERQLLEPVERQILQGLSCGAASLERVGSENVDEKVGGLRPLEVPEKLRQPDEAHAGLLAVVEAEGLLCRLREDRKLVLLVGVPDAGVERSNRTFGGVQVFDEAGEVGGGSGGRGHRARGVVRLGVSVAFFRASRFGRIGYDVTVRARDVLGPTSPLGARFERYEERPGQIEMAEAVEAALAREQPLFVEAGTGTGKTLAYLVPAILSGKKVVVSTATKALQEQIWTKDLPLLEGVLREQGKTFRAAMMKGLSNYVCKRRLTEALGAMPSLDRSLSKVLAWVEKSGQGDRAELASVPEDDMVWRDVTSSTDTRIGPDCRYFDECFVTRMRARADEADIVIVNHHLFFADLALRSGKSGEYASAIPKYDAVVFDEAHQLEEVATDFFGARVSQVRVEGLVRDAGRSLSAAIDAKDRISALLDGAQRHSQAFFRALSATDGPSLAPGRRALSPADYGNAAKAAHAKLDAALEALAGYADANVAKGEAVALVARRARDLRSDLTRIVRGAFAAADEKDAPEEGRRVAWIDVGPRTVSLGSSPIDLGATLRRALFDRTSTVICTSATLATNLGAEPASFHFARSRLGAPSETRELIVPSPFDFERRAALYLPKDLPEPADPAFEAAAIERIRELIAITGGGAFVLCTSTRAMKRMYEGVRRGSQRLVLVQGEAPKHTLLERFREAEDAVLVATMSFWEGVDVPGRALRLVILDKIPFAVPTDPLVAARSAEVDRQGGNAFAEYSVPAAAITLKQGFGRLLRTQDDVGIVAILDRRIVLRGYGRRLLESLPPAKRLSQLEEVRGFWAPFADP